MQNFLDVIMFCLVWKVYVAFLCMRMLSCKQLKLRTHFPIALYRVAIVLLVYKTTKILFNRRCLVYLECQYLADNNKNISHNILQYFSEVHEIERKLLSLKTKTALGNVKKTNILLTRLTFTYKMIILDFDVKQDEHYYKSEKCRGSPRQQQKWDRKLNYLNSIQYAVQEIITDFIQVKLTSIHLKRDVKNSFKLLFNKQKDLSKKLCLSRYNQLHTLRYLISQETILS